MQLTENRERRQLNNQRLIICTLTCTSASCCGSVHSRVLENLNELTTKCRDVLFDLVDIIFCDTFTLCLALLDGYVPPDQIPHDTLPTQVRDLSRIPLTVR